MKGCFQSQKAENYCPEYEKGKSKFTSEEIRFGMETEERGSMTAGFHWELNIEE